MENLKNIIFMKYGIHTDEEINSIIERKQKEYKLCKKMFWGYGGTVCHPMNQVQPFIKELPKGQTVYLVMSLTTSNPRNPHSVATHYSDDRNNWLKIPMGIKVTGSKYAIVCGDLKECNFDLDLSKYSVPVGPSKGKILSDYIKARVDKSCGVLTNETTSPREERRVKISLIAEVIKPYSVFIKMEPEC